MIPDPFIGQWIGNINPGGSSNPAYGWTGERKLLSTQSTVDGAAGFNSIISLAKAPSSATRKLRVRAYLLASVARGAGVMTVALARMQKGAGARTGLDGTGDFTVLGVKNSHSAIAYGDGVLHDFDLDYLIDPQTTDSVTVEIGVARLQQNPHQWITGNIYVNRAEANWSANLPGNDDSAVSWLELTEWGLITSENPLDGGGGGGSGTPGKVLTDDSVIPAYLDADTDAKKLAFRQRIKAGDVEQNDVLRGRRFAAGDNDPQGQQPDGTFSLVTSANAALQAGGSLSAVAGLQFAFHPATYGTDPNIPGVSVTAEDLEPFFDGIIALGGPLWMTLTEQGSTHVSYALAHTFTKSENSNLYGALVAGWVNPKVIDTAGLSWNIELSVACPVPMAEYFADRTLANLTAVAASFWALASTSVTQQFKSAVRSPRDPYTFSANYTRRANGSAANVDGYISFNNDPVLITDMEDYVTGAVQMSIRFHDADLAPAVARWLVHNEFVWGTGTYRIAGAAVQNAGNLYLASVQLIRGTNPAVASSNKPTLQPDTPHRSELADVAFSGSYDDLTNKPDILGDRNTTADLPASPTAAVDILTGLADSDTVIVSLSGTVSSNVVERTVINHADFFSTERRVLLGIGGYNNAILVSYSDGTLKARRANTSTSSVTAYAWKLG